MKGFLKWPRLGLLESEPCRTTDLWYSQHKGLPIAYCDTPRNDVVVQIAHAKFSPVASL